jgi:hypothetical protein
MRNYPPCRQADFGLDSEVPAPRRSAWLAIADEVIE